MDQRIQSAEDRLTDEEVQAIVRRYGERQAGADTRATVADVAEALHVEPDVVSRLLREVRTADSEKVLRERLERLESENESLRRRAEGSEYDGFYGPSYWSQRRMRAHRPRMVVAAAMAALIAIGFAMGGSGRTPVPAVGIVVFGLIVFLVLRAIRRKAWL